MKNYGITAVLVAVFALTSLIGFSSGAAQTQAEELTLRMLIWEGYAPQEMRDSFAQQMSEKHGIDVKFDVKYVEGNDDFFPAVKAGQADVIAPSHPVLKDERWKFIQLKLVAPVNLDNVPNYKNLLPKLQKADYCTQGGDVYAVPHVCGPYGLAYNTELVKEAPTSWNCLWDPSYKGQYTLGRDAYIHNVSLTALANGVQSDKIYDYRTLNNPTIQDKLQNLVANAGPMWVGVDDPDTLKGLKLAVVWGFSLPALKEMGETWKIAEPTEGTTGWVDNFAMTYTVLDNPKLKLIAEEWLNFVLSDEYQVYDVRGLACVPVTTTVKSKLNKEEIASLHLDDPTHFEKNRILWKVLDKKDRNGLKRLWEMACEGQ